MKHIAPFLSSLVVCLSCVCACVHVSFPLSLVASGQGFCDGQHMTAMGGGCISSFTSTLRQATSLIKHNQGSNHDSNDCNGMSWNVGGNYHEEMCALSESVFLV